MTVSTEVDHNEYTGNGVTTSFPYTFRIFKKSDLVVQVVDLNENITELILDTDYTVTGAGGYTGGNVVLAAPLASGYQISISRELPVTQEIDLRNQGKFFAETHEDAFDKLTMLIQQCFGFLRLALRRPSIVANYYDALGNYIRNVKDPSQAQDAATKNYVDSLADSNLSRTLRVPDPINSLPAAADRANKMPAFDSAGNAIVVLPPDGSASDVLIQLAARDGSSLVGGIENQLFVKTGLTIQAGGTVNSFWQVVYDEVSGMWYQWTGSTPHVFAASPTTPDQSYQGWICRGFLKQFSVNDPRNYGAHPRYELGYVEFDSAPAIQLMIDSVRFSLPNAGTNYTMHFIDRQSLDFNGQVYNISKPIEIQDDHVSGLRASGIRVTNGGLRALSGFTPATQKNNSAGDDVSLSAMIIIGTKNYATQSGHYSNYIRIDNFSFDGNNFSADSAIYCDMAAYATLTNISASDVIYGVSGKVVFLSEISSWKLFNVNSIIHFDNTSVVDGYNSGLGLEGGGVLLNDIIITADGKVGVVTPRLYFDKLGEVTGSNIISYNGKGDFIYIRSTNGGPTGTQSKWSRFRNIEVGDIGGRIINIAFSECVEFQITAIKCGYLLGGIAPLVEINNCAYIEIHPAFHQFYDLPSAWKEVVSVVDSAGVNIHPGIMQAIPAGDNLFSMIAFKGNSQRCNVGALVSNISSNAKKYIFPVSSESTCKAISVIGGSFIIGAFINGGPSLKGVGDSYTAVNTGDSLPIDSPRTLLSLSNTTVPDTTFRERQYILKNVSSSGGALVSVNFIDTLVHCAEIEISVSATTASGSGSYFARYKVRFTRASNSTSRVNISSAIEPYSDGSSSTMSVSLTETHTQYGVVINVIPSFSGSSAESTCNIVGLCRISSHFAFVN